MTDNKRYSNHCYCYITISILIWLCIFTPPVPLSAQYSITDTQPLSGLRPVTQIYRIELGSLNALSTYLSPLHYTGTSLGVSGRWSKTLPATPRIIMDFDAAVNYSSMLNPRGTAGMLNLKAGFTWGLSYRITPVPKLQITTGANVGIGGGAFYLTRNGNNPVTAIASAGLGLNGAISYHFKIGRLPIVIEDRVNIPSLNIFFSPQYGETYYEIYLGNHSNLVHAGWWGNNSGINNLLSVYLDFGRTAMQIGYRADYHNQWNDHLLTRTMRHAFTIGVIPHGLGLRY